jgi:hypothetical protein
LEIVVDLGYCCLDISQNILKLLEPISIGIAVDDENWTFFVCDEFRIHDVCVVEYLEFGVVGISPIANITSRVRRSTSQFELKPIGS